MNQNYLIQFKSDGHLWSLRFFAWILSMTFMTSTMIAQTISGLVTDDNNDALIGATVIEKGTTNGTVTDIDGAFTIDLTTADPVLILSYVGYASKEMPITADMTDFGFVLYEGTDLDEVIVTALGISREKKSLTFSADEISGEELTNVKDANFINALSGKSAGVFINKSSSGIGGSTQVVLRGNGSTRNNNVLYVIDGVPMLNFTPAQAQNVFGQSGVSGGAGRDGGDFIGNLNPDDIESMTVLRGASAAALYGSQAANGAILITTKSGKAGKTRIDVSSNFTSDMAIQRPELQFRYGQTSDGAVDSWGAPISNVNNHVDDYFQNGNTWINSIALSGGTDKFTTYASYANTRGEGVLPGNEFRKHNLNIRETAHFFNNKLKLTGSVNYINQNIDNRISSGLYFNQLSGLYFFPRGLDFSEYDRNFEVFNSDRNLSVQNWVADNDNQQNPYWIRRRNTTTDVRNRIIPSVKLDYKFNDWVSVQMRYSLDKATDKYQQNSYAGTQATLADANGRLTSQHVESSLSYRDVILTLNKNISNLSVVANVGAVRSDRRGVITDIDSKGSGTGLEVPNAFTTQNIIQGQAIWAERADRERLNSVFGSVSLGYKSMLYLDVTGRNDWSSTLAFTPNTSFFYPSFGMSAILTEMTDISGIDFAKARLSYAEVGNGVSPFDTYLRNEFNNSRGLEPADRPPFGTTLKPELNKSFEAGIEIKFLSNRVGLDLTYYDSKISNQRLTVLAPPTDGGGLYIINGGKIQNKGIEALLELTPVKSSNFEWTSSFNFSKNDNTVLELPEDILNSNEFFLTDAGVSNYSNGIKVGGSFGDIYGKQFARDESGNIVVNSDGVPVAADGGLEVVGNPNPDFMLGFNNSIRYKNLHLKFLIDGRFGGEVMSITEAMLDELGVSETTALARDNGGVEVNGALLDAQEYYQTVGGRAGITENYIYDATNIRLREVALGYSVPKSVVDGWGVISGLKVQLIGRNLLFLKNNAPFDPNVSLTNGVGLQGLDVFSAPATRSLGFNVSVSF